MRPYRSLLLSLALLGALAPRLAAQEGVVVFDSPRRAWFGFSYEMTETRKPGERLLTLGVESVVAGSPAEKAGLKKGDTILRINNLGASEQLLTSLGSSLSPGDTVTFRIRRDGREQDLRLVAAKPPAGYAGRMMKVRVRPDSVAKYVQIITDSLRKNMDSSVFKYLRGDSVLRLYGLMADSLRVHADSLARHFFYLQRDSLRPQLDSARLQLLRGKVMVDSLRFGGRADSIFFFGGDHEGALTLRRTPGEVAVRAYVAGMRAVAGAELQELNPELARYFRADEGVLVVNAAPGSPARRAGLQAGDVIVAAAGQKVTTIAQLRRAIELAGKQGSSVKLELIREGARRSIELPR